METYDDEDMRRAVAKGEWQVWGRTVDREEWLASGDDEAKAKAFAEQVRAHLGVPVTAAKIV